MALGRAVIGKVQVFRDPTGRMFIARESRASPVASTKVGMTAQGLVATCPFCSRPEALDAGPRCCLARARRNCVLDPRPHRLRVVDGVTVPSVKESLREMGPSG